MKQKKVLVVGNGAREHIIISKIKQSPILDCVYTTNKNFAGFANYLDSNLEDLHLLARLCKENVIDTVIVGQEKYLAEGIADILHSEDIGVFGPCKNAAKLESSKFFAKELCNMHNIPTANYGYFSDKELAIDYVKKTGLPIVIKADGLASGKGVFICKTQEDAKAAIEDLLVNNRFGKAGQNIIIEEFLEGKEVSYFALTDGKSVLSLGHAQDYKQVEKDGKLYNTGGMGSVSPGSITKDTEHEIMRKIIYPIVNALSSLGIVYKGVLFAGVILTKKGPKVLEYNVRLGDPEAQVVLSRLENDFLDLVIKTIDVSLSSTQIKLSKDSAACLVLASNGYPMGYKSGIEIPNLQNAKKIENLDLYYAGIYTDENGGVFSDGGRVLSLVSSSQSIDECVNTVYKAAETINWRDGFYLTKEDFLKKIK